MKKYVKVQRDSFIGLAIISTGFLMYNMLAIIIFREQVFIDKSNISVVEIPILIGFLILMLFDIISFLWMLSGFRYLKEGFARSKVLLLLWVLCIISLLGTKVMADEIGREYLLGWEVIGEWIILYIFLTIHLTYNLLILFKSLRGYKVIWQ
jgi:hypothetical protein